VVHKSQAAGEREALADVECRRRTGLLPLDAEKIDANHRSPTFLRARPTATAAVEASSVGSPLSFFESHVTVRNGSKSSTGTPKRSHNMSRKPCTRDAPPLRMIRSIRSEEAVALKKSNVF